MCSGDEDRSENGIEKILVIDSYADALNLEKNYFL